MSPDDRQLFDEQDRGFSDKKADRGFSDRNQFAEQIGLDRELTDRGLDDRNLAAAAGAAGAGADRGVDDRNLASDRGLAPEDRGIDDAELEEWLTASGDVARRNASPLRPSPIYAAELRERLVTRLETTRPPLLSFALGRRIARAVPVSAAVLLFAAALVGAAQLNLGAPEPSESPVAATDEASPSFDPDQSFVPLPSGDAPFVPAATPTPAPDTTPAPHVPDPTPPPKPPAPTPTPPPPGPAPMTLSLKSCDGGVVITWSKYKAGGFNHYTTLRNTVNNVPLAYPPQGGAVDFGGTYSTDVHALSAVDTSGATGVTYYYRTMAFNAADGVVGATAIGSATAFPVASLGTLGVTPDPGGTLVTWTPYAGNGGCFTWYKLVASTTNPNPSYLTGDPYLYADSNQGAGSTVVSDLVSGETYYLRMQAIRSTHLGLFVAAQSNVVTYTVP